MNSAFSPHHWLQIATAMAAISGYFYTGTWGVLRADEFVLLANGEVLQGAVETYPDHLVVKFANKGQLTVDKLDVQQVSTSLLEIYEQLRTELDQPLAGWDRVRLAEWCLLQGLHDQCTGLLAELAATDGTSIPQVRQLELRLNDARSAASAGPSVYQPPKPAHRSEDTELDERIPKEHLAEFRSFVQPLLLNSCARCHSAVHDTPFTLQRARQGRSVSQRMTYANLLSVLAAIERGSLLDSCCQAHGDSGQGPDDAPNCRWRHGQFERLRQWSQSVASQSHRTILGTIDSAQESMVTDPFDPIEFNRESP